MYFFRSFVLKKLPLFYPKGRIFSKFLFLLLKKARRHHSQRKIGYSRLSRKIKLLHPFFFCSYLLAFVAWMSFFMQLGFYTWFSNIGRKQTKNKINKSNVHGENVEKETLLLLLLSFFCSSSWSWLLQYVIVLWHYYTIKLNISFRETYVNSFLRHLSSSLLHLFLLGWLCTKGCLLCTVNNILIISQQPATLLWKCCSLVY